MKNMILGLMSFFLFSFAQHEQSIINSFESPFIQQSTPTSKPTSCITGIFHSTGNQYWRSIQLKLTNTCNTALDLQDAVITFQNSFDLETSFWGKFSSLSYPDNQLKITSQPDGKGTFLSTLHLHFPNYSGANSKLPPGASILIQYGAASEGFLQGTAKVYLNEGNQISTGSINFINTAAKPSNITQDHIVVHLVSNGQKVSDIQLSWQGNETVSGLTPKTYAFSVDNLTDSKGITYTGTVSPPTINLAAGQIAQTTITYTQAKQTGKLAIQLQALPNELAGYTGKPLVVVTEMGGGSSTSFNLAWNTTSTVTQLKNGTKYTFAAASIHYNGVQWNPIFTPPSLIANETPSALTRLTYQRPQVIQNTVTLNVRGAPASLSSIDVTLTPSIGTEVIDTVIPLVNGSGSNVVLLPDGVVYSVSTESIPGYSVNFASQPLTSAPNITEIITFHSLPTGTPVTVNGQLKVIGTQLCNEQNQPIQLKGMSTHGLQWYADCLDSTSLDELVNNFKANVIRISLYVQEGGYETDPNGFTHQVNQLIKAASDRGIYAIVDWHILNPGDPNYNFDRARTFFTAIANANKGRKNLIYEIANEPNGVSWATIKNYADRLIPIIRAIDPNTVILVGTPGWSSLGISDGRNSQDIINAPLNFPNIMYAFHFYAASHRDNYLNELDRASNVLPIFVSEFGTQTYSGGGTNDFTMSDRYIKLMTQKKISWTSWNYSDDSLSGAIWKPGTCPKGPWTDTNLKPAGVYIKNKIRE